MISDLKKTLFYRAGRRSKTVTIFQQEAAECGPACMAMVMGHYGLTLALSTLRALSGVNRDGSQAGRLLRVATHFGFDSLVVSAPLDQVARLQTPSILHWQDNHFVVFEGVRGKTVYLNDPALGQRRLGLDEAKAAYSNSAILIKPGKRFQQSRPSSPKINAMRRDSEGLQWPLLYMALATLGSAFILGLQPLFFAVFVDRILIPQQFLALPRLLLMMFVSLGLCGLFSGLYRQQHLTFLRRIQYEWSARYLWMLLMAPAALYEHRSSQHFIQKLTQLFWLSEQAWLHLVDLAMRVLCSLYLVGLLFIIDGKLAIFALLSAVLLFAVSWVVRDAQEGLQSRLFYDRHQLNAHTEHGLNTLSQLKVSGLDAQFVKTWSGFIARWMRTQSQLDRLTPFIEQLPGFLTASLYIIFLCLVLTFNILGSISLGLGLASLGLLVLCLRPLSDLFDGMIALRHFPGLYAAWVDPPFADFTSVSAPLSPTATVSSTLKLQDVTFSYDPLSDTPLLTHIQLSIQAGQHWAIAGASGAGKTTLCKLMAGLLQPLRGRVDVPHVMYIGASPTLHQGKGLDLLSFSDGAITEAEIATIIACLDLHDVFSVRRGGYDCDIQANARNFSGGEAQRIQLAQALLAQPDVLIIDEALTALDQDRLDRIASLIRDLGITTVWVTHSGSILSQCEQVLFLENGQISARGTHEILMKQSAAYARGVHEVSNG